MLGLSTDPISLWHAGTKRFSKVEMKIPLLPGLDPHWAVVLLEDTIWANKNKEATQWGTEYKIRRQAVNNEMWQTFAQMKWECKAQKSIVVRRKPEPDLKQLPQTSNSGFICVAAFSKAPELTCVVKVC